MVASVSTRCDRGLAVIARARRLFLRVDIDGVVARQFALLRTGRRRLGLFRAFIETLHRTAKIGADIAQLLRAEHQRDDQQSDQPVPNTQRTHDYSPEPRRRVSTRQKPSALRPESKRARPLSVTSTPLRGNARGLDRPGRAIDAGAQHGLSRSE